MRRSLFIVFFAAVLTLAFSGQPATAIRAQTTERAKMSVWTTDDVVLAEQASGFEISPDDRWVVWVKSAPDMQKDRLTSNIIISSLAEPREVELTRGSDNANSPKWSPKGSQIAFLMSRTAGQPAGIASEQLWMVNPFGGEPWRITSFARSISDFAWIDEDTLVFLSQEEPSLYENSVKRTDNSVVIEDEAHEPPSRLYRYSIATKKVTRLTENKDQIEDFAMSRGGRYAVTVHKQSLRYEYDNKERPLVFLYDLASGVRKQILSETKFNVRDIKWTPDDSGFYVVNAFKDDPTYQWAVLTEAYFFDLRSGEVSKINIGWDRGLSGSVVPTRDGFLAQLADGVRNKLARFRRAGNSWSREWLTGEHSSNIFGLLIGKDGRTLAYNHSTASKPIQWYRSNLEGNSISRPEQITHLNESLKKRTISKTEIVRWKGALSEEVEGLLYYPHDYKPGKPYPLVVMIHGGPALVDYDAWKETWHYPHNLYTQRGAFVLAPNYHGSSNYGPKWSQSIAGGNYYDLEIPDIEKGVDHLIDRGLVDREKLGVLGWSNGSLLAIALTTRTTRYKAAGAGAGVVDWSSDWANAYFGASFNNYYFGKAPLEDPERYVRKSPFYQLDKVRTPTIIFFGEDDRTVAPSQGWMHYRALQQSGKTDVRFVLFPDTGHSLRKLSHQRRKIDEELDWFDQYLFKTFNPKNESLLPNSPLDDLLKRGTIKATNGRYGEKVKGKLLPEFVEYEGMQVGRFEVTRAQYAEFDASFKIAPGTENHPVNAVTFEQARSYAEWLGKLTGNSYRLPNDSEAVTLYDGNSSNENTLDFWAGYSVNPEDSVRLGELIGSLPGNAPLLKEVGSFKGVGSENLVFDLEGNVAEWITNGRESRAAGRSADMPKDSRTRTPRPGSAYIGFRILNVK